MKTENNIQQIVSCGIAYDDALSLRRISMTLRRWHERECGAGGDHAEFSIERDEETGKPFQRVYYHRTGTTAKWPIPDLERGALKRLSKIMANYPELKSYVQGDPRGCSLYLIRPWDVPEGKEVDAYYSRGIPVY